MKSKNSLYMRRTILILICAVLILTTLGLVMLYSSSMVRGGSQYDNAEHFIARQLIWLSVSLMAGIVCARIDLRWVRTKALPLAGLCVLLLILVRIPGFGFRINGSWRWLRLGSLTLQPSEFAKIGLILVMAWWIAPRQRYMNNFKRGLLPALGVLGLFCGLLMIEPDLGTTTLFGAVALSLLLAGGARWTHLLGFAGAGAGALTVFVLNDPNRLGRIMAFRDPVKYAQGAAWQLSKGLDAFASGGAFGSGLGNSIQKYYYLPESHTDFILPIIGEESGLGGSLIVLILFFILFICGMRIAVNASDSFGRFTALGITLMITVQALINMAVVTGLAPTKGLALPFISYGGSSLLVSSAMVGLLINVAYEVLDPKVKARQALFKDRCRTTC
jgi:cell division protein FtsW